MEHERSFIGTPQVLKGRSRISGMKQVEYERVTSNRISTLHTCVIWKRTLKYNETYPGMCLPLQVSDGSLVLLGYRLHTTLATFCQGGSISRVGKYPFHPMNPIQVPFTSRVINCVQDTNYHKYKHKLKLLRCAESRRTHRNR